MLRINQDIIYLGHIGMRKYQWREVMGFDPKKDKPDGDGVFNLVNKFMCEVPENAKIEKGNYYWDIDQKMISVYISQ